MSNLLNDGISKQEVLDTMFSLIVNNDRISSYAMKGGYILANYICNNTQLRSTSDIDMSVETEFDFDSVINAVTPYLGSLKSKGLIYGYKIKKPLVTATRNMSGGIKVYKKFSENSRKRVFVGIDISLHSLSYGVITYKGFKMFSLERTIADKISATYNPEERVIKRIRDLYDLYLLNLLNISLNKTLLNLCLIKRKVSLEEKSTVEKMLESQEGYTRLRNTIENFFNEGKRVDSELIIAKNITFEKVMNSYYYILDLLRS